MIFPIPGAEPRLISLDLRTTPHVMESRFSRAAELRQREQTKSEVQTKVDSPDASTIPWLLLRAKSTGGSGTFARTTFIHRLDTTGGRAPTGGCDAGKANSETRVDYTANYYFYEAFR